MVILGPQGAGKGTQSLLLSEKYGLEHIEMGALLRNLVAKHPRSALAKKVARYMNAGKLAPFAIVEQLMEQKIQKLHGKGIVFDGFPRHPAQAKALQRILRLRYHAAIDGVLLLTITKKESIRRLSTRVVCSSCHRSWTIGTQIASATAPCPFCKGKVSRRADDTREAILKRLAVYERDTKPLAQAYARKKMLYTVHGERPVRAVFGDVNKAFLAIREDMHHG